MATVRQTLLRHAPKILWSVVLLLMPGLILSLLLLA